MDNTQRGLFALAVMIVGAVVLFQIAKTQTVTRFVEGKKK